MGKRILVIEDDHATQDALRAFFELEGFETDSAFDGEEALEKLKVSPQLPALILVDVMMMPMNGLAFRTQQLQDPRLSTIPTILMSADDRLQRMNQSVKCSAYIKKPINIDELLKTVRCFCGKTSE